MRISRSASLSCCSFCRLTESFSSGITPMVIIVSTVMVMTSSIRVNPRCCFFDMALETDMTTRRPESRTAFISSPRVELLKSCTACVNSHLLFDYYPNRRQIKSHICRVSCHYVGCARVETQTRVSSRQRFDIDEEP